MTPKVNNPSAVPKQNAPVVSQLVASNQNLQNASSMNVPQQQRSKGQTALERLQEFEQKKGLSVRSKRQAIENMQKYEKGRPELIKKKIAKEKSLQGKIKCLKDDCNKFFPRLAVVHRHLAEEHKQCSDRMGIYLFPCELCQQFSSLKEWVLERHQVTCLKQQRAILITKGELSEDEALNTEEELAYQQAQKYN